MKKSKRMLALSLSTILLLSIFPISTLAQNSATIAVSSVSGNRGDTVTLNVSTTSGSHMQACSFDLLYDKDNFEIVSATKGTALVATPIINTNIAGKVVFSYAATSPIVSSGSLLTISFKIKDNAEYGVSGIDLTVKEYADGSFENINYSINQGTVTVLAPKLEAPDNIELTNVGDTYAEIMWTGNDEATGYNVYLNGSLLNEVPLTDNIYYLTNLSQDTTYELQVSNYNYTVESDRSATFTFNTNKSIYEVLFVDWNYNVLDVVEGSVLGYQAVEHGSDVTVPGSPTREGYTFIGWDQELTNITSDMVIQAQYEINTYTVRYLDRDGTVLSIQTVEHGSNAISPEEPQQEGLIFAGWNDTGEAITGDTDITALYREETYTVTFVDENGEILSTLEYIEKGSSITPPEAPTKEGYTFVGWSSSCENITENKTISPLYEINKYTVIFKGMNDVAISTFNDVEHGSSVTAPSAPRVEGYAFICWDKEFNNITSDLIVNAVYTISDESAPQIVVETKRGVAGQQVDVNIILKNNPGIVSATLRVGFDSENMTLIKVTDAGKLGAQSHKPELISPYTLAWVNDTARENLEFDGIIVTLTFEIAEDAELGDYPITISYNYDNYDIYNVGAEKVRFTTVNGAISVIDTIIGDVNGDGLVNNLDRMVLTRYLADWEEYTENDIDFIAADVNADNLVNNLDRMILTRYLADWSGYESLPYEG